MATDPGPAPRASGGDGCCSWLCPSSPEKQAARAAREAEKVYQKQENQRQRQEDRRQKLEAEREAREKARLEAERKRREAEERAFQENIARARAAKEKSDAELAAAQLRAAQAEDEVERAGLHLEEQKAAREQANTRLEEATHARDKMFDQHKELLGQLQQAQQSFAQSEKAFVEQEHAKGGYLDACHALARAQEEEAEKRADSNRTSAELREKQAELTLKQEQDKVAKQEGERLQAEVEQLTVEIPNLLHDVLVLTVELERLRRLQVQFFKNKVNDTQYLFKLLKFLETAIESTVMSVLTIAVLFIELDLGAMTSWTQLKPTDNTLLFATSLGLSIMSTACTPQPALTPAHQSPVELCGLRQMASTASCPACTRPPCRTTGPVGRGARQATRRGGRRSSAATARGRGTRRAWASRRGGRSCSSSS